MSKAQTKTGAGAIRDVFVTGRRIMDELKAQSPDDPDPNWPRDGIKPGKWEGQPHGRMPPLCPVHVIGRDADGIVWCRNAKGDLRGLVKWDMSVIVDLFAPYINYAFWAWPAFGEVKIEEQQEDGTTKVISMLKVKRIERDKLFTCLAMEASKRPLFDPEKQHRGRGGWEDRAGNFIWHSGKYMWRVQGRELVHVEPGEHDGFLYTRQPSTIEPWDGPVSQEESPAQAILADLMTWNFERHYMDPILLLGWIAVALMGGALKARPIIFSTGGAGVGKSTLHQLLKHILDNVVFASVNTSAAGIYQRMKTDSLPVMVDELESKPGNDRAESVIELARVAYTGGNVDRGGADHKGVSFGMHSAFFFSAINRPAMGEQDKTRMAILNLARLEQVGSAGRMSVRREDTDGRMILRQVMDGWTDFNKRLLPFWWNVLQEQGLDSRAIDTYGTLLAAAELLVGPDALVKAGLPVDNHQQLGAIIKEATSVDREEILDEWHKLTNHLLSSAIDGWKSGQKPTVGAVVDKLMDGGLLIDEARERLELADLGIKPAGACGQAGSGPYLCVPSAGPNLERMFNGKAWHKGVWFTTLKQAPKQIVVREREHTAVKINGSTKRCLLIDVKAFQAFTAAGAPTAPVKRDPVDDLDVF